MTTRAPMQTRAVSLPGLTASPASLVEGEIAAHQPAFAMPANALPAVVQEVLQSPGEPLTPSTRARTEPPFGHDFSRVRVHHDARAAESAKAVDAPAFTVGKDIVFGTGQYTPESPVGRHLLAHELAHVVQQSRAAHEGPLTVAPASSVAEQQARAAADAVDRDIAVPALSSAPWQLAKAPASRQEQGPSLEDRIKRIDELLSYGLLDWEITDAEAVEAFTLLKRMTNEERVTTFQRIRVDRLLGNLPRPYLTEFAVMLVAAASAAEIRNRIWSLLSSFLFDWFVTADDAVKAVNLLEALPATDRDYTLDWLGPVRRKRLWEKLPPAERPRADRLWQGKQERIYERQAAAMAPAVAQSEGTRDPVERKRREFNEWLDARRDFDFDATLRYSTWVERESANPEFLTLKPEDLYARMKEDVEKKRQASADAREEGRRKGEAAAAQTQQEFEKWKEFDDFFHQRLRHVNQMVLEGKMTETEARVQEEVLLRFNAWIGANQKKKAFQKANPRKIFEDLARDVITLEVDRSIMRAGSAPKGVEAKQKKMEEFQVLGARLHAYRQRFPYLIPDPSHHRDILVTGDPAQQKVFDAIEADLRRWAIEHFKDDDFTAQSATSVLATIVRANQPELKQAQLEPLVFESFARTDLDPGIVAKSFVTNLGKILLVTAIVGLIVGAEILTAGQITWILVALVGVMGTKAYLDRREEIKTTGVDVPEAASVVHAAGDVIGLSQLIEGITGTRLGTEKRLGTEQRSEELGEGTANVAGLFLGSRPFKLGKQAGAAWRAAAPMTGGRLASAALLPGPPEHFPFGSGRDPLPTPSAPNRIYRIMSMEEAAEILKTKRIPGKTGGTMNSKFFGLDSNYVMLFREKSLATVGEMGEGIAKMEANLGQLEGRLRQVEAAGNKARAAELRGRADKLRADIQQKTVDARAKAESLIKDWYEAPGQKVVIEIELAPGALEHILNRAVPEPLISQYQGKNVFIWKFERGYGNNVAVPSWQLDLFNQLIVDVRLHAERGVNLFGQRKLPQGSN